VTKQNGYTIALRPNREFKQILEKFCARTPLALFEYRIVRVGTEKKSQDAPKMRLSKKRYRISSRASVNYSCKVQVPDGSTGFVALLMPILQLYLVCTGVKSKYASISPTVYDGGRSEWHRHRRSIK
jgi:hypothetical protein